MTKILFDQNQIKPGEKNDLMNEVAKATIAIFLTIFICFLLS